MQTADIKQLDLNLLLIFDALMKERSVTSVAKALDLSQPNVSYALKKLRAFFGDELFVRSPRGIQPTAKAFELIEPITRMLAILHDEVLVPSNFEPEISKRNFVINTTDIGEMVFLPPILRRFRTSAPHVSMECVCLGTSALVQALKDGKVDLAIGYLPELTTQSVYSQSLFIHPFVCMMREDHPLAKSEFSVKDYAQAEHVGLVGEGHGQRKFEDQIGKSGIERRIAFRSQNFMNIPFIVRDTDLIATVPKVIAVAFMGTPGVLAVRPPFEVPPIPIKQYWSDRQKADQGHMWLRRTVADLFQNKDPTMDIHYGRVPKSR